ncbi:MAG TPA: nucleoside triphosphate pyrophosphohydrolase, partial [Chloroflexota bacterium]|nr:nucleoside triphosphate pyrophosphohydrolase [Chloroflexota bacterium]
ALFVPPVAPTDDRRTFAGLMNVTRILRAPGGCPWDREQTHASLKIHLIEEVYEVVEALDEADDVKLREELGDLLFQIAIHAQIAAEMDEFDIGDILGGICGKLIRRHPHVFGDLDLPTAQSVLRRWESFKQSEKPDRDSILSGIPTSMPALPYSYAIQRRAANQGFEWHDVLGVLRKVREELDELESEITHEGGQARILDELGDVFFALVSLGRWLKSDPEEALRFANRKFVGRFRQVEALCREEGKSLSQLSDEEVDRLWQRAKEEPAA